MKYLLETPIKGTIGSEKYKTTIHWRNGVLITDEPEKLGGRHGLKWSQFRLKRTVLFTLRQGETKKKNTKRTP
jgi:hypothetical protein